MALHEPGFGIFEYALLQRNRKDCRVQEYFGP
jgi:hypothetical protein